jgi:DNA-binding IclR family transcriptional regulator
LATPIFDSLGKAFAAVSVTAPTARCNEAKRAMIIAEVKHTGDAIFARLDEFALRGSLPSGASVARVS